jgi:transketolase
MADEMRKVLYESVLKVMRENEKVVSINADLGKADGLLPLRQIFPDRDFDVGVAEQNMAGIAAGMASYGLIPIINSFAAFSSRRICDQVAVSICYANQNVKIIGTDPGIAAELNGGTHMTFEDIGVMRSIPDMMIVEPSDAMELSQMLPAIVAHEGPVYMRMYRKVAPDVHDEEYRYELGKADQLREGKDLTIICSGILVSEAVEAGKVLEGLGIQTDILNVHTIKPIDKEAIVASVKKTGVVVTCENHNILGGLRAAVAEVVTESWPVRIYPIGSIDTKGEVGKLPYLKEQFGLTAANIVKVAETAMKEKQR